MGLDVSTYVVFGQTMDKSFVKSNHKERGCKHETDLDKKFCAECGKPVWIEQDEDLLESMDSGKLSYFYTDYHSNKIVIGFVLNKSRSHRSCDPDFLEVIEPTKKMFEELVKFFETNNIPYDVADFKVYAFSNFSY